MTINVHEHLSTGSREINISLETDALTIFPEFLFLCTALHASPAFGCPCRAPVEPRAGVCGDGAKDETLNPLTTKMPPVYVEGCDMVLCGVLFGVTWADK